MICYLVFIPYLRVTIQSHNNQKNKTAMKKEKLTYGNKGYSQKEIGIMLIVSFVATISAIVIPVIITLMIRG